MSNKKLRTLAALTSALIAANAGTFAASADSSAGFNSVIKAPETDNISYISGEYSTLPQIKDTDRYELSIESQPEKTVYLTGEELDLTGLELACLHQPDISAELWDGNYFDTYEIPLSELIENGTIIIDDSEFDNTKAGFYNIYITYGNVTESVRVRVKEVKEQDKITLTSEPINTIYKIGEEFDLTGTWLILKDKETNEKTEYYDIYELIDNGTITVDSSEFDNTQEGIYPIFITYDGETVEFDVRVFEYYEGYYLGISKNTVKKVYKIGEELDLTGAKFNGSYCNNFMHGDFFYSNLAEYIEKGTLILDDSEFDNTKAGTYTIYVHYGTATDSFEVTVVEASESITTTTTTSAATTTTTTTTPVFEITTTTYQAPSYSYNLSVYPYEESETIYKLGEELDFSGICVHGYGGGDDYYADIPYISLDKCSSVTIDASEFDNTKPGTYTIYVKWYDAVDSFEVTVLDTPALTKGDANGDGEFTIADMVSVQNNLLGKKTAKLADWKAADLYPDGRIDVYDFIVMRSEFIKNFK